MNYVLKHGKIYTLDSERPVPYPAEGMLTRGSARFSIPAMGIQRRVSDRFSIPRRLADRGGAGREKPEGHSRGLAIVAGIRTSDLQIIPHLMLRSYGRRAWPFPAFALQDCPPPLLPRRMLLSPLSISLPLGSIFVWHFFSSLGLD